MADLPARILNVDDDEAKRYSITRVLKSGGFEVTEACTGEEALRLAAGHPDLIVLDVNLPDIHGMEVCRRLKADPATASIAVLHVSGQSVRTADRVQGLDSGADGYLTEPVEAAELLATVNALLRARRAEELARHLLSLEQAARAEAVEQAAKLEAANAELRTLNQELAAANAALAAQQEQLHRLNQELEKLHQRKDEFLAMLGHELRNPLHAVSNALHLLEQAELPDARAERHREVAARQTGQLTRLVEDLLDVARISRGTIELRKRPVSLATIVEDAVQGCLPFIQERQHHLAVSLPPEPVWLDADPERLVQIVVNLLNNACKFTPPGGRIWLTVEGSGFRVQGSEEGSGQEQSAVGRRQKAEGSEGDYSPLTTHHSPLLNPGEAVIRVRDTGMGISAETLPHIFDLFIQADRTLDRSQGGLGIGLNLVRSLVQMHGGSITASSEGPGRGAEFVVRLPIAERGSQRPEDAWDVQAASPNPQSRRVLVVEDNPDAAETLAEIVETWGHQVRVAGTGTAAVALAREFHPEVVLCDVGLPGMDGYQVAEQLRKDEGGRMEAEGNSLHPFLVAVTGYGQETDVRRAQEAGFDAHLTKPIDLDTLRRLLVALVV